MRSFLDVSLLFERTCPPSSSDKKGERMKKKQRICKLYEAATTFFLSGGVGITDSFWRNVVNGYQRGLENEKYGLQLCMLL